MNQGWTDGYDWRNNEGVIDYDEDDDINNTQEEQALHSTYISNRIDQLSKAPNAISWSTTQFQSEIEIDLSDNPHPFELLEHLELFYGFVPPLKTNSLSWNLDDWNDCMKTIGWYAGDRNPPLNKFEAIVISFIKDVSANQTPDISDLNRNSYRAITSSELDKVIIYVDIPDEEVYMVRQESLKAPYFPWSIALKNAKDALFVYRLLRNRDLSALSLSNFLLENGIAFTTLLALNPICSSRTLNNDETMLPMRLSGYTFGPDDYEAYIHHRARFLTSPRGRAALLRGGIVARIAREHIGLDSATLGPSSAITVHRLGKHYTATNGVQFWDDELSENEIGIICGLHRCFTGMAFNFLLIQLLIFFKR